MQIIFCAWKIFLLHINIRVRFSQVLIDYLRVILQLNVEEDESFSGGDITIPSSAPYHVGKGLGNDGGHQAFGVVFEVGHRVLGRRHPDPIDDLIQIQRGTVGPQDVAEMGKGELMGCFIFDDQGRLVEVLNRRVDTNLIGPGTAYGGGRMGRRKGFQLLRL